jgi:arylsulfatase A-like enzyme
MAYLHRRGLAAMHIEDFRKRAGANNYTATEPTPLPEEAYCDNWIGANGLELLSGVPAGKPWFLQVNFTGPHSPLDITRRMERTVRQLEYPGPHDASLLSPEKHTAIRRNYAAMIENIDRWLGLYIAELRRRGELENTLIVYSSDHGEMLGDHDRWGKSVPFQPSVCVPLIVSGLGVAKGAVSDALVSNVDFASTFLEFAGAPRLRDSDSRSLVGLLESKATSHREFVRSGLDRWRMVYDGRYKLVRGFELAQTGKKAKQGPNGGEPKLLLFDLKLDPQEASNLLRGAPNQVERLSKLLS